MVNHQSNLLRMEPRISTVKQNQGLDQRIEALETENGLLHQLLQKQIDINQQKSVFLAKVSHELRSPLTSIQLSAALIEHYYYRLNEEKIFGHLTKIKDGVSDFVVILNNYLLAEESEKADEDQLTE